MRLDFETSLLLGPAGDHIKVELDGQVVESPFFADEELGLVAFYVRESRQLVRDGDGDPKRDSAIGKVMITSGTLTRHQLEILVADVQLVLTRVRARTLREMDEEKMDRVGELSEPLGRERDGR